MVMQEEGGEPQSFTQPVHHIHLQLCTCRTGGLCRTSQIICLITMLCHCYGLWMKTCKLFSYPGESNTVDGISQHVPEHRGPWCQTGVVGVHVRTLPVNHLRRRRTNSSCMLHFRKLKFQLLLWQQMRVVTYSRHDDFLNVLKDALPVLRLRGRSVREKLLHVAWFHIWNDSPLPDGAQVLCDVIHHLLPWAVKTTVVAEITFPVICIMLFNWRWQRNITFTQTTGLNYWNGAHNYLCCCILQPAYWFSCRVFEYMCGQTGGRILQGCCLYSTAESQNYIDTVEEHALSWWRISNPDKTFCPFRNGWLTALMYRRVTKVWCWIIYL